MPQKFVVFVLWLFWGISISKKKKIENQYPFTFYEIVAGILFYKFWQKSYNLSQTDNKNVNMCPFNISFFRDTGNKIPSRT